MPDGRMATCSGMARLEDLIAAVYADPEDPVPRQILGDHLLERGDRRGELIQIQCALMGMSATDPRRPALLACERALTARKRWPTGSRMSFERGFAVIELEAPMIDRVKPLIVDEPLVERITIRECGGHTESGWNAIRGFIGKLMHRVRVFRLEDVIWYWYEGSGEPERIDESESCARMLARLPPRDRHHRFELPECGHIA